MDLHPTPSSCEPPCARGLIRGTVEKLSRPSLTRFGREAGNQRTALYLHVYLTRNFLRIADKITYAMEQGIMLPSLHPDKFLEKHGRCQT